MQRLYLFLLLLILVASCAPDTGGELSSDDITHIATTLQEYRQAWIDNDTAKVMASISEGIILYLPGESSSNISGKAAVREFWFPPSEIKYPIRVYEISDQEIFGSGTYATAQGRSLLAWDTMKGDSLVASDTSVSDFLTILKKEQSHWRIYRQMFQMRKSR